MKSWRDPIRLTTVSSTMDEVDARARDGAAEGLVVVADEQTAGRGRMGRKWVAPAGSSILCSLLLRPNVSPDRLSTLPLMCGVAVADAIAAVTGIECLLKWPNDLLIDRSKVCGILMQSRLKPAGVDFVVVGIGINVSTPDHLLVPGATSLEIESSSSVSRETLLIELVSRLHQRYDEYVAADGRPSMDAWRARAAFLGDEITIAVNEEECSGNFAGIDEAGRLILETSPGTTLALSGGEIQRGPRYVRPES